MKQRRYFAFSIIVASIVLFSVAPVFATWDSVLTTRGAHSGFFFNEFVGLVGSTGSDGIYKTTDGGKIWVRAIVPAGFPNGYITQIFMTDLLRGWAAIEDFHTKQCIWMTTDGGLNWQVKGPVGQFDNIYETPSAVVAIGRDGFNNGVISTDGGVTFLASNLRIDNGIDFVDNLHGVVTGFTDTIPWMRTVDGGKTWNVITPQVKMESWSVYGVKGTSIFYSAAENDPSNRPGKPGGTKITKSADYGATWSQISSLPFYTTGHIAGFGEMLYLQMDNDNSINPPGGGLYRSIDKGVTWQSIGGPTNKQDSLHPLRDTRFVVTGCSGGVIYAFDQNGKVWKTRDGGDGQIQEPPIAPLITGDPIVFSGPICATSNAALKIENFYCLEDTILSAQLVDTTSDIIKSGALKVTVMPSFPLLLVPNARDSIRFTWQPFKVFHTDTTVTIQVKIRYFSKILGQAFDTTVTIFVHAIGEIPDANVTPIKLNFDSIPFCAPHDTSFTVRNNGCDTLYILSANGGSSQHYLVLDSNGYPLQFPVKIPPSDSDKIIIRLILDTAGNYSSNLILKLKHQGIEKDTAINIAAFISAKASFTLPDSIDFGAVSTCRTVDSLLKIKNTACVPITIASASLKYNTVFFLKGSPPYTSPILPNATGTVDVQFSPNIQQSYVDTLTLIFFALGELQTRKIVVKGSGIVTAAKFETSLATDTLFDLKLTRCDKPDTFNITLSNPGCFKKQKISILNAVLQGIATPDILLSLGGNLPTDISAGTDAGLRATVVPKDLGTFSGFLHITYLIQGDSVIHDTLMSYFLSVGYGTRILTVDHDTIDLGTMKFCDVRDSAANIKNIGCDLLDIMSVTIQGQGNFTVTVPSGLSPLVANISGRIPFHFEPTQAGFITGTMTITSVSDTLPVRVVTILAHVIPTDTLTFNLLPTHSIFYAGDTLTVRLIPQQNIHGKGLRNVSFTLNYNGDLLTLLPDPVGVKVLIGNAITLSTPKVLGTPKHSTVRVSLVGFPTLEFDSLVPAIEFRFLTSLTDSITTTFVLSNIELNDSDKIYAKCDLGILSASVSYELAFKCGDSTLIRYMQLGNNLKLFADAVYPNPLSDKNNFQAIIPFTTNISGLIGIKVFDQVGRTVISNELASTGAGRYQFTIDGRSLSAGCYTYMLQEISSSSSVRGRFIITK